MHKILAPNDWLPPKGYANGISAEGQQIYVAGQIGWDAQQRFVGDGITEQAEQALQNIVAVLAEAGAKPEHVVRLTWYVVDKREYLAAGRALGAAYRRVFGKHFPAMSAVQVVALIEDRARVEIEATAVIPKVSEPTR
jgi:enamine deaminase RidA (YjgF/YER057c/UK114 family)